VDYIEFMDGTRTGPGTVVIEITHVVFNDLAATPGIPDRVNDVYGWGKIAHIKIHK
jgi:hypothetical protein